jgi:phytoene dehydrogenase-like protein
MFLGLYYGENVNFPEGGSLALIKAVEKTFLDLGGKIKYKTTVKKSLQKTTVLSEYNLRMNLYTNQIS